MKTATSREPRKSSAKRSRNTASRKAASCCTCWPRVPRRHVHLAQIGHPLCRRRPSAGPRRSHGEDISQAAATSPAVLETLFHSPEFWSQQSYRAKVKTPIEFVASAARAGNASIDDMQPLVNALRDMGMPLYGAVPPTGYKWDAADWVSTGALVNRMNFALAVAANKLGIGRCTHVEPRRAKRGSNAESHPRSRRAAIGVAADCRRRKRLNAHCCPRTIPAPRHNFKARRIPGSQEDQASRCPIRETGSSRHRS
jgi:hypothetical protein